MKIVTNSTSIGIINHDYIWVGRVDGDPPTNYISLNITIIRETSYIQEIRHHTKTINLLPRTLQLSPARSSPLHLPFWHPSKVEVEIHGEWNDD